MQKMSSICAALLPKTLHSRIGFQLPAVLARERDVISSDHPQVVTFVSLITGSSSNLTMVRFVTLISLLLASSSAAFASRRSAVTVPRSAVAADRALKMSGGAEVVPDLKVPASLYQGAVAAGAAKAGAPFGKIFKLGIVSGCHIAFGAFLMIAVGGACPGIAAENPGLQKIISGAFGLPCT